MRLRVKKNLATQIEREKRSDSMQEALKTFKEYLTSNNLKLTQQRLLIFKVFMSNEEKLSSDKLLRAVQELDIRISRSTVYRTVKHLLNSGIARCIQRGDGSTHYESMGDHHSQMICERCGKRYPISNPYIDCLQQETARQQGFTMFSFQTQIHGICNQCTPSESEREIASEHHVPPKMKQGV